MADNLGNSPKFVADELDPQIIAKVFVSNYLADRIVSSRTEPRGSGYGLVQQVSGKLEDLADHAAS